VVSSKGVLVPRRGLLTFGAIGLVLGCNALNGAADIRFQEVAADGGQPSSEGGPPAPSPTTPPAPVPPGPTAPAGWSYGRAVDVISDAPTELTSHVVEIPLAAGWDAGHASPTGADLRFRMTGSTTDLPYFIEPGGDPSTPVHHVWVRLPTVPRGETKAIAQLYYGNAGAAAQSSFEATFTKVFRTSGKGTKVTLKGDLDVDWFEVLEGDTVDLGNVPTRIFARRAIVAGVIDGTGHGHPGGTTENTAGTGPGGGGGVASNGAGGGGYGGAGGQGGSDTGQGAPGGPANGTAAGDDIAWGSGGGAGRQPGGAGGGAISIFAWRTHVSGAVRVNGVAGTQSSSGQSGGGGAGGGILLAASSLDLGAASLEAKGGQGGGTVTAATDAGGGGGGGRIKLRKRPSGSYVAPSMGLEVDRGGGGGGPGQPGSPGSPGTTHVDEASLLLTGVEAALGPEARLNAN